MDYIHIKNLDKYHPGYKDRDLKWAKIYFKIITGDPEFELIRSEIDKWRFIAMICLELHARGPLPNSEDYWKSRFDTKKRKMSLTLQMLQRFLEVVTNSGETCNRDTRNRDTCNRDIEEDKDKDKDKEKEKEKEKEERYGVAFAPPSLSEVTSYCHERKNLVEPEKWLSHYQANGWMVGRNKMKDWRAAVRTWEKSDHPPNKYDYVR